MENLSTYLPNTSAATLEPFFQAYDNSDTDLISFTEKHVREVAADIDGATEKMIEEDSINLTSAIRGFFDDMWESREAAINDDYELDELAQDY